MTKEVIYERVEDGSLTITKTVADDSVFQAILKARSGGEDTSLSFHIQGKVHNVMASHMQILH